MLHGCVCVGHIISFTCGIRDCIECVFCPTRGDMLCVINVNLYTKLASNATQLVFRWMAYLFVERRYKWHTIFVNFNLNALTVLSWNCSIGIILKPMCWYVMCSRVLFFHLTANESVHWHIFLINRHTGSGYFLIKKRSFVKTLLLFDMVFSIVY